MVLLTIGANDIKFSGLVADVIIEARTERALFSRGGHLASVPELQVILDRNLPNDFARLRNALKPLVEGDFSRVVFVSYGHPALAGPGKSCPGGRDGFDVHPAFGADPERLRRVVDFVSNQFLPKIEAIAALPGQALPRSRKRADDVCRRPSDRFRQPRRLRPRGHRSRIRSRSASRTKAKVFAPISRRRPPIRWCAADRRASTGPMRRARAGSGPPTTATSPP